MDGGTAEPFLASLRRDSGGPCGLLGRKRHSARLGDGFSVPCVEVRCGSVDELCRDHAITQTPRPSRVGDNDAAPSGAQDDRDLRECLGAAGHLVSRDQQPTSNVADDARTLSVTRDK